MPEVMNNAAASGEAKLVPVVQLKKWHRDLDACQKVIWLRGGFDPAYCLDAQDCLKEMEAVLTAPVPPAAMDESNFAPGGWKIERTPDGGFCLSHPTHGRGFFSDRGHKPAVVVSRFLDALLAYGPTAERLQAENAALQQRLMKVQDQRDTIHVDLAKANDDALEYMTKMKRAEKECDALQQRLNTADQRVDELEDAATVASMRIRELDLTFGRYLLGMKAAVIADESGGNGMEWIFNGLAGPGELPPEDERDAQAYFDREVEGIDAGLSEVFAFHGARRKARQVKP